MAIIALAAVKLARLTNQRDPRLWAISAITLLVTAVTGAEIALVFIAAGLLMVVWDAPPSFLRRGASRAALLPLGLPALSLGMINAGTQGALFLFFLKAGAFIFGSGLAIVPFLREGVVTQHDWLTQHQFLDAVAMGLITPGPVVITATFIGYLVGGFLGAIVATVAIFTPIYLGVVLPGRWFVRHSKDPRVQAFVKGATAAKHILDKTISRGIPAIRGLTTALRQDRKTRVCMSEELHVVAEPFRLATNSRRLVTLGQSGVQPTRRMFYGTPLEMQLRSA